MKNLKNNSGVHYVLDGYNIIHKVPVFEKLLARSLEEARRGLIGFCKTILQSRGDVAKITVVFDGKAEIFPEEIASGPVEIFYTVTGEDADDRILEYLQKEKPRQAAVVSDDNYIRNNAKALAVRIVPVREFLTLSSRFSSSKKTKARVLGSSLEKKIGVKEGNDITQAYADYLGLE